MDKKKKDDSTNQKDRAERYVWKPDEIVIEKKDRDKK